jgi:hypothetical protein
VGYSRKYDLRAVHLRCSPAERQPRVLGNECKLASRLVFLSSDACWFISSFVTGSGLVLFLDVIVSSHSSRTAYCIVNAVHYQILLQMGYYRCVSREECPDQE